MSSKIQVNLNWIGLALIIAAIASCTAYNTGQLEETKRHQMTIEANCNTEEVSQ